MYSSLFSFELIKLKAVCPKMFFFFASKNNAHIKNFPGIKLKLDISDGDIDTDFPYLKVCDGCYYISLWPLSFDVWRRVDPLSWYLASPLHHQSVQTEKNASANFLRTRQDVTNPNRKQLPLEKSHNSTRPQGRAHACGQSGWQEEAFHHFFTVFKTQK